MSAKNERPQLSQVSYGQALTASTYKTNKSYALFRSQVNDEIRLYNRRSGVLRLLLFCTLPRNDGQVSPHPFGPSQQTISSSGQRSVSVSPLFSGVGALHYRNKQVLESEKLHLVTSIKIFSSIMKNPGRRSTAPGAAGLIANLGQSPSNLVARWKTRPAALPDLALIKTGNRRGRSTADRRRRAEFDPTGQSGTARSCAGSFSRLSHHKSAAAPSPGQCIRPRVGLCTP